MVFGRCENVELSFKKEKASLRIELAPFSAVSTNYLFLKNH